LLISQCSKACCVALPDPVLLLTFFLQMSLAERDKKRHSLTLGELEKLPEGTPTYQSCGKMFVMVRTAVFYSVRCGSTVFPQQTLSLALLPRPPFHVFVLHHPLCNTHTTCCHPSILFHPASHLSFVNTRIPRVSHYTFKNSLPLFLLLPSSHLQKYP